MCRLQCVVDAVRALPDMRETAQGTAVVAGGHLVQTDPVSLVCSARICPLVDTGNHIKYYAHYYLGEIIRGLFQKPLATTSLEWYFHFHPRYHPWLSRIPASVWSQEVVEHIHK